jgi:hypothetical protein
MSLELLTKSSSKSSSTSSDMSENFRELSIEIAALGKQAGVTITPYLDPSLPYFTALPEDQKSDILHQLRVYRNICNQVVASGHALTNALKVLWSSIDQLNLRPPSDLFGRLDKDDVFEINDGHFQIFRSFSYYQYCSYTLEDLYCRPWPKLWERDGALTDEILDIIDRTIKTKQTVWANTKTHLVRECASNECYNLNYKLQFMAPLYDQSTNHSNYALVGIKVGFADSIEKSEKSQSPLDA